MATNKDVKIYDMNHEKRGIALVINISKYDQTTNEEKPKERVWSKKDVDNLTHTLKYLEFDIELAENSSPIQGDFVYFFFW